MSTRSVMQKRLGKQVAKRPSTSTPAPNYDARQELATTLAADPVVQLVQRLYGTKELAWEVAASTREVCSTLPPPKPRKQPVCTACNTPLLCRTAVPEARCDKCGQLTPVPLQLEDAEEDTAPSKCAPGFLLIENVVQQLGYSEQLEAAAKSCYVISAQRLERHDFCPLATACLLHVRPPPVEASVFRCDRCKATHTSAKALRVHTCGEATFHPCRKASSQRAQQKRPLAQTP